MKGWMSIVKRGLALWLALILGIPLPAAAQTPVQPSQSSEGQPPPVMVPASPEAVPRFLRESAEFPLISIVDPRNGGLVTREDQGVVITFRDPRNDLDLGTFQVLVNGTDRTQQFQVGPSGAMWRPGAQVQGGIFVHGQNTIVASIKNRTGNLATTSAAFVFDTTTILTTTPGPRSSLERAFLQPPELPPTETGRRAPAVPQISRDLVQFGYEAFRTLLPSLTPAMTVPVSPDYRLGPGDNLMLYVWNLPGTALYDSTTLGVDRAGAVFVPRVGSFPVQGLTLAEAQEAIRSRLARYYSGFELRLALGELRAISVYVVGEVNRPGTYMLSPFSTMIDALFSAGGPTKMGSLRNIRVTRGRRTVGEADLYDFLLRGERNFGSALETGDTVFVPPIGPVAGITGEVKRPGIYELRGGTTLDALLGMAGGPLPSAQLERIQVERVQGLGKIILDLPFPTSNTGQSSSLVQNGDMVTLFPASDRLQNAVTLQGYVTDPGRYEWKPGMRLSEVLKPDNLLPEAYRDRVELIRVGSDFTREVIPIDLKDLWGAQGRPGQAQDILLRPNDRISVQSEVVGPWRVTLSGEFKRPGTYMITKGERISSAIRRAGGFTDRAYPKAAVFTRESVQQSERKKIDEFVLVQQEALLAEAAAISAGTAAGADQGVAVRESLAQRQALLRVLAQRAAVGRVVLRVGTPEKLEGTESDLVLENGDSLTVPVKPSSVLVLGSVRNPTALLHEPGAAAEDYINKAGGLTKQADPDEVYIVKADGSTIVGYVKVRDLEPGDTIVVPPSTEPKYLKLPLWRDVATIFGQFGLAIAGIAAAFK